MATKGKGKRGGKRVGAGRKPGLASIIAEKSRAYIAEELQKNLKPIVSKAIEDAKGGGKYAKSAREWLSDQAFGKPTQPISGPDGKDLFPNDADRVAAAKALSDL